MKKELVYIFLFFCATAFSQEKLEREYRILKSQFPDIAYYENKLGDGIKKTRYYKEVSATETLFTAKFKKDRLQYQMIYTKEGKLQSIQFSIKKVDVPMDAYENMEKQLNTLFDKWKLLKMNQVYSIKSKETEEETFKNAFQNLMLPSIGYKLIVKGKKAGQRIQKEFWFNARGEIVFNRDMLPANYDRVLY